MAAYDLIKTRVKTTSGFSNPHAAAAVGDALVERLVAVEDELKDIAAAFSLKTLTGRHVAFAWKKASLAVDNATKAIKATKAKKKKTAQAGGNPGTTLPAEYYGDTSWSYHPLAEVKIHEGSTDTTPTETRGALPIKELALYQEGGSSIKFAQEKDFASMQDGFKLNKDGQAAMANFSNSFTSVLLSVSNKKGTNTPAALRKLARTL